ncbi:MAG: ATP synthase F1 subunit gamma [Thermaerobacter sp.]|nr:ATP synthase F1 subunit gamma [Thermaerobacter sp.]
MAAGGLQDLKRRIKSVENTRQITRAMKLVAGAKLRRAQERAESSRSYFDTIRQVMQRASASAGSAAKAQLFAERPVKTTGYVVVTSDRGLAGPFNANVLRYAAGRMRAGDGQASVFAVGRKGRDAYRRRRLMIQDEFVGLGDDVHYSQAKAVADAIMGRFQAGEVDRVELVYTHFVNAMTQRPAHVQLLPVRPPLAEADGPRDDDADAYVFEPDAETVLADLVPRYIEVQVYGALLESKASEHGARMTAMDAASKNSDELLRQMTLSRNRLRQAAITREIAELVSGAAALE